jgi:hypothetical protein
MRTPLKPGSIVDITIKGVPVVGLNALTGAPTITDERGDEYPMPSQAAIKLAGQSEPVDAATLQERINSALAAIDHLADEETLAPWAANGLRKRLDPNPRHWPPQPGDVWDDGMPFGGSQWFAQVVHGDSRSDLVMVSEERHDNSRRNQISPEELLASAAEVRLAYRRKTGDND